ncbi:iron ABC transporter permease [Cyclobacteriaceae bacterium]|nr:iron ABC transporter permease [Cyclobacteriaceae bacterium]
MRKLIYIAAIVLSLLFVGYVLLFHGQEQGFSLASLTSDESIILFQIRLPRLAIGFLVGGGLALSGYLLQHITNNSLADPYLLGTSGGASLGANLVISGVAFGGVTLLNVAFGALLMATIVTVVLLILATEKGHVNVFKLLLGGVSITSMCGALNALLIYLVNDQSKVAEIVFWSMGSLSRAKWDVAILIAICLLLSIVVITIYSKELMMMLVGHQKAKVLGMNVEQFKWVVISISTILTSVSVAFTGPVGFVGLFVPHFIRAVYGVAGRFNVIFVVLTGGVFLVVCDAIGKLLYAPIGLPIGVVTALIGVPFFVWLVVKSDYKF